VQKSKEEQELSGAKHVQIQAGTVSIYGDLAIPEKATGMVVFAHGSGSSRFSPRNRFVAEKLQKGNIATLLVDLLTGEEERIDERTMQFRFDIGLLTERLVYATRFVEQDSSTKDLHVGYFGASTGAAAALKAGALHPEAIRAIVSRGGRPDLAAGVLGKVKAAVLLIVGGEDYTVIQLNKQALEQLVSARSRELVIIPGATHLFEEPGALDKVATHARDWFGEYL